MYPREERCLPLDHPGAPLPLRDRGSPTAWPVDIQAGTSPALTGPTTAVTADAVPTPQRRMEASSADEGVVTVVALI